MSPGNLLEIIPADLFDTLNKLLHTTKLECGPMPNMMAALPNIGIALCSMPQSLADTQYWNAVQ